MNERGWQVKKEVSLGDAVAIAVALSSVIGVYFKLDTRVSLTERDITEIKLNLADMKREIKEELKDIKATVTEIRDRLPPRK